MSHSSGSKTGVILSPCVVKERINIRHLRRVPPIYYNNQALLTAFATASLLAFMVIYLEVSRLLIPDTTLSRRELRHLTQGFANDMPQQEKHGRHFPLHMTLRKQKPSAIVIGFSHCGADYILDELALHPDVAINRRNLHFFDQGNKTEDWYISNMPFTLAHHVTIDVSLDYVTNTSALTLTTAFDKNIRIIVVVCNPVMRLIQHHASDFLQEVPVTFLRNAFRSNNSDNWPTTTKKRQYGVHNGTMKNSKDMKLQATIFPRTQQTSQTQNSKEFQHIREGKHDETDHSINITNIISKLKSKVVQEYKNGEQILNSRFLQENGDFFGHISKALTIFHRKQVHIIEQERFFNNRKDEMTRLLNFLGVRYALPKDLQVKTLKRTTNSSATNVLKVLSLFDILKTKDRHFFTKINSFYNPLNRKLFSFLEENYHW